jgi:hypothetical protein
MSASHQFEALSVRNNEPVFIKVVLQRGARQKQPGRRRSPAQTLGPLRLGVLDLRARDVNSSRITWDGARTSTHHVALVTYQHACAFEEPLDARFLGYAKKKHLLTRLLCSTRVNKWTSRLPS